MEQKGDEVVSSSPSESSPRSPPAWAAVSTAVDEATAPQPSPYRSLIEEVQIRGNQALSSLAPSFQRCVGSKVEGASSFRCLSCDVEGVCAVCVQACHVGHEVVFVSSDTAFTCSCGSETCHARGRRARGDSTLTPHRHPVAYLVALLASERATRILSGAQVPKGEALSQQQPGNPTSRFGVRISEDKAFDLWKGVEGFKSIIEVCAKSGILMHRMASSADYFAVCEGLHVTLVNLSASLCLVPHGPATPADIGVAPLFDVPDVLCSIDVSFCALQLAFHPTNPRLLLVAGLASCVLLVLDEVGQLERKIPVVYSAESSDLIRRIVWVPDASRNEFCLLTGTRVKRIVVTNLKQSFSLSPTFSYRVHGESIVDAAFLKTSQLLVLCQSGCVLRQDFAMCDAEKELLLYDYVIFHPSPIISVVVSLTPTSDTSFLLHSSHGMFLIKLDGKTGRVTSNVPLKFSTSDLVRTKDKPALDFSQLAVLSNKLLFIPVPQRQVQRRQSPLCVLILESPSIARMVVPEMTQEAFGGGKFVGLASWNGGRRVVGVLDSGVMVSCFSVPSNQPRKKGEELPSPALFSHFLHVSPNSSDKVARRLFEVATTVMTIRQGVSPESIKNLLILDSGESGSLTYSSKEVDLVMGLASPSYCLSAFTLWFGKENFPLSVRVFGRTVALGMKHAVVVNNSASPVCVQVLLTRSELDLAVSLGGVKITLVRAPNFSQVSISALDVFVIDRERVAFLYPTSAKTELGTDTAVIFPATRLLGGLDGPRFDSPSDFGKSKELLTIMQADMHAVKTWSAFKLRSVGRATFHFPRAMDCKLASMAALPELMEMLEERMASFKARAQDVVLAFFAICLSATRVLQSVSTFANAVRSVFARGPESGRAATSALLAMFHSPLRKPARFPLEVHDAYCCDLCLEFPIRGARYNCLICSDFDVCEECFHRVPFEHEHAAPAFSRVPSDVGEDSISGVYCTHCGKAAQLKPHGALCKVCHEIGANGYAPSTAFWVDPKAVATILAAGELNSLEMVHFLVLSAACTPPFDGSEVRAALDRCLASDVELALHGMAQAESFLPGQFAALLPIALSSVETELLQDGRDKDGLVGAVVGFCRQIRDFPDGTAFDLRRLWCLSFRDLSEEVKGRLYSVLRHQFGCKEPYLAMAKLATLSGLVEELQRRSESIVIQERSCVVESLKIVLELKASNSGIWPKMRLEAPRFVSACLKSAIVFHKLGLNPAPAVQLVLRCVEEVGVPGFAVDFLFDALVHPTNGSLRYAALRVLSEGYDSKVMDEVLWGVVSRHVRNSSVGVECLLLLSVRPGVVHDARAVVTQVLNLLRGQHYAFQFRWKDALPTMLMAHGAVKPGGVHPFSLLLSPEACLDCAKHGTVENRFVSTPLDSRQVAFTPNSVMFKLGQVESEFRSISVEFTPMQAFVRGGGTSSSSSSIVEKIVCHVASGDNLNSAEWHEVGALTDFASLKSDKNFSGRVEFDPWPPSGNLVKLDFVLANSALLDTRCPRCSRAVPRGDAVVASSMCSNCGEMLNQCRQCRNINYGDPHGFLCTQCGYCRHLKFSFFAETRNSVGRVKPLTSETEFNALRNTWWESEETQVPELLAEARAGVLAAVKDANVLRFLQEVASPGLSSAYTSAHFAALQSHAIKERLAEWRQPPSEFRLTDRLGCFQCTYSSCTASLVLLASLCRTHDVGDQLKAALPFLVALDEALLPFHRFARICLPKSCHASSEPVVELVAASPGVLDTFLSQLRASSDTATSVRLLSQLAVRSGVDQTAVIAVLEEFIRSGRQVEACVAAMQLVASHARPSTVSPQAKRVRVGSEL